MTKYRKQRRCIQGMTLMEVVVVIVVIAVLAYISVPCCTCGGGRMTKRMANAKEIYKGLIGYAMDNDGRFPSTSPNGDPLRNSNQAFRNLIPKYIPVEKVFSSSGSAWSPAVPDEVITQGAKLSRGENYYAYVPGMENTSRAELPLIADGFEKGKPGTYSSVPGTKGFVQTAVVVRVDGSAMLERVDETSMRVIGRRGKLPKGDLFEISSNWLRPDQKPLNPE